VSGEQLKKRTQAFGLEIIALIQTLPDRSSQRTIGQQLLRSGTSVGANFRAAARAQSRPDFIAKLKIVEEECDESIYWLELLDAVTKDASSIRPLIDEANQILSIVVASIKTARRNS
jgi:four helix bundle protein